MQIHLSPDIEVGFAELAAQAGQTPEQLVISLIAEKLSHEDRFRQSVVEGLASLDRSEFRTQDELEARFANYLRD